MLIFASRGPAPRPESAGRKPARPAPTPPLPEPTGRWQRRVVAISLACLFASIAGQLARLAWRTDAAISAALVDPVVTTFSRPDIVDRNGRLLATDIEVHSLYADPNRILDADDAIEKLSALLPGLDEADLRRALADASKRFVWIRRGLSPRIAQAVHDLGLPGFSFRKELRRAYPLGALAGHVLGAVNADNKGVSGVERTIDETVGIDGVHASRPSERPPVRLSLEIGAQAGLEAELADAVTRFHAAGAAAVILDARSGEIVAAASLPRIEPARASDALDPLKKDRLQSGAYELGSIFKTMTIAMALDRGQVTPDTQIDVRAPLVAGRFEIKDLHPAGRPLSVTEIFLLSSNVGAGMLALDAGTAEQQVFLARAGLLSPMKTEAGPMAAPQIPARWDRTETITISYGHGIAVAPLQFAASAAALVNGGMAIAPTYFMRKSTGDAPPPVRVVSAETSTAIRALMRANVTSADGTGRRAGVPGYDVGGKTGTADIAGPRGYRQGGVISSFLAAFPMSAPRYVALVLIFEPKPTAESGGKVLAGLTAAPATGRIIARLGPLLAR